MSTSAVSSFGKSLDIRMRYLEEISGHLKNYRTDSRVMIVRAMENPHSGFSPCLHQLVSNLYDQVSSANREKSENRKELWGQFKEIRGGVVEHISSKKRASKDQAALKANNVWMSQANGIDVPKFFEASDHIADFLCLARISVKEKLSEDVCQLSGAINDLLSGDLNEYLQLLENEESTDPLAKEYRALLIDLDKAYTQNQYDKAIQCIQSLEQLKPFSVINLLSS